MDYQFKKFEDRNIKSENRITLTKSHSIGLPNKFYQDNEIKNFTYAVLYWDEKNQAIGIYFTSEKEKAGFKIIHGQKYGGQIVIRSFLKSNNINPEIYHGRYEWEKHNLEGAETLFVIKLQEHNK
ncbi:MAG: hypothetical protein V1819_02430 [bacterium]